MAPSMDKMCLDCRRCTFELSDVVDTQLKEGGVKQYPERGRYYFNVTCPVCDRKQGLVIRPAESQMFTIWPCSWDNSPCGEVGCEYCGGKYV